MKLHELARVPGATLEGDGEIEITGIQYDSRRVKPGDLFVAVSGIRADGHVFIHDALAAGAPVLGARTGVPRWVGLAGELAVAPGRKVLAVARAEKPVGAGAVGCRARLPHRALLCPARPASALAGCRC